jgi:large subunit ribosomal protein L2
LVDFLELTHLGVPATVVSLEKDPNRSALIALLQYANGAKAYVLAAAGVAVGQTVVAGPEAPVAPGNRLLIKNIPIGTTISNLELFPGKGGQMARSAGSSATLMSIDSGKAQVRLSSGEIRLVNVECYATVGGVSNFEHGAEKIGKAGRNRWKGKRPAVRGSAMNPVDHPHGGGEGRQGIGLKHPKTPWGKPALGKKTRRKKRTSDQYIVKRRSKKK